MAVSSAIYQWGGGTQRQWGHSMAPEVWADGICWCCQAERVVKRCLADLWETKGLVLGHSPLHCSWCPCWEREVSQLQWNRYPVWHPAKHTAESQTKNLCADSCSVFSHGSSPLEAAAGGFIGIPLKYLPGKVLCYFYYLSNPSSGWKLLLIKHSSCSCLLHKSVLIHNVQALFCTERHPSLQPSGLLRPR